jgi:hypothetical protein
LTFGSKKVEETAEEVAEETAPVAEEAPATDAE